jgi:hypothetical protein
MQRAGGAKRLREAALAAFVSPKRSKPLQSELHIPPLLRQQQRQTQRQQREADSQQQQGEVQWGRRQQQHQHHLLQLQRQQQQGEVQREHQHILTQVHAQDKQQQQQQQQQQVRLEQGGDDQDYARCIVAALRAFERGLSQLRHDLCRLITRADTSGSVDTGAGGVSSRSRAEEQLPTAQQQLLLLLEIKLATLAAAGQRSVAAAAEIDPRVQALRLGQVHRRDQGQVGVRGPEVISLLDSEEQDAAAFGAAATAAEAVAGADFAAAAGAAAEGTAVDLEDKEGRAQREWTGEEPGFDARLHFDAPFTQLAVK